MFAKKSKKCQMIFKIISLNLFELQSSNNIISMIFDNRQTNF